MDNQVDDKLHCHFKCMSCGGDLAYTPGEQVLTCPSCGFENRVPKSDHCVRELDFFDHLDQVVCGEEQIEAPVVECDSCGARTTFDPHIVSDLCPYCGSDIIIKDASVKEIKPKSILPFHLKRDKAEEKYKQWLKSRWFAPSALKKEANLKKQFNGIYVPYWTYDCDSFTRYSGQRGDAYYVSEQYTTTENGKTVTKTRRVRKIRWTSVSGHVYNTFDDLLVLASRSLPQKFANALEPWDLHNLEPYQDQYLSGFKAECYQVDLKEGFVKAKAMTEDTIEDSIRRDIGGDEQRIQSMNASYDNITFKHILLPIWLSAYRFKEKTYRVLVNARTGEVQGERPWSWLKITLASLAAAVCVGLIIWFVNKNSG